MAEESYRRNNDPRPLEVEPSTAGATRAGDLVAPNGLQLDLLCAIVRLEQVKDLLKDGRDDFALFLVTDRIIKCDVRRLRGHLTPETLAWAKALLDEEG